MSTIEIKKDKKPTVRELRKLLAKVPDQDAAVSLEGCDCYGQWLGQLDLEGDYVVFRR